LGIRPDSRPEDFSVEEFTALFQKLKVSREN
jgi:hypothetical protein